ncbi:pectinesterase [Marchantia polymorpha subsp. ruderalis]|uniref:Pectinesterase n=2 Tax=Marchantia polymorpha TaxID=3197 RepID=A0AAF6B535_MARPO|nr:hypothetical protein MARPO_0066s0024 [Marchantia polymorpha]BBN07119.1 hypothetical protein Mp_4g01190 [Marchantia polymorpha subsp. ruderalis]|eukprot:PTQ36065.1 hypothetical protein MARPO_0066s0024 [Marchantia polymorpha]
MSTMNFKALSACCLMLLLLGDGARSLAATVINVRLDGSGDYTTVQEAVDAVPTSNKERVTIRIFSGIYLEKVYIPSNKPYITFKGYGLTTPVISWNDNATTAGSTWATSTVAIDAKNFIARRISFKNTAPPPAAGASGGQAIALRISGDKAAFYNCEFWGAQDTLCDMQGRHYFKSCFIQGSIDFIFGNGQSIYTGCHINSIAKTAGSITAQYRQSTTDVTGFSFVNCNVTGTGSVYLGRAWGSAARVVFSSSVLGSLVNSRGWNDWNNASLDSTVYFGEYNNTGPGADTSKRVSYFYNLSEDEVTSFVDLSFISANDWFDSTMY